MSELATWVMAMAGLGAIIGSIALADDAREKYRADGHHRRAARDGFTALWVLVFGAWAAIWALMTWAGYVR